MAIAYSVANRAGCASVVWVSPSSAGASGKSTVRRSMPSSSASRSAHASRAAANTGSLAYRPRLIPGYCAPCPGKRNTTFAGVVPASALRTRPGSAPESSAAASAVPAATTALR